MGVVVRWAEEAVPAFDAGKTIVENDGGVADFSDFVESVAVILFGCGATAGKVGQKRLVKKLNRDDNILVSGDSVFVGDLCENVVGEGGGVARRPFRSAGPLTGVIETVLGERCTCSKMSLVLRNTDSSETYRAGQSRPSGQSDGPIQWPCQGNLVLP